MRVTELAIPRPSFWTSPSIRQFAATAVLMGVLIGAFWVLDKVEPAEYHTHGIVGDRPVAAE